MVRVRRLPTPSVTVATLRRWKSGRSKASAGQSKKALEAGQLDKFSFSQAVSYHFVFQDTVSAGLIASDDIDCTNGTLNNVFLVPQVENSSYESDGVLAAGNVYGFSESFDLSNFVAGQPAVASGTSDLLFTFTASPRAVFARWAVRPRCRRDVPPQGEAGVTVQILGVLNVPTKGSRPLELLRLCG